MVNTHTTTAISQEAAAELCFLTTLLDIIHIKLHGCI